MLKKLINFLKIEIWRIRLKSLPRHKYLLFRPLRIFLLALRGFNEDKCQLRASALTFYSLLSIVPVLAMAFGIAKGFGFEKMLETQLLEKLQGQEEIAQRVIVFSNSFLANTKGGVVAGIGVVLLFWTVIKVLGNIENSFNDIWGIKKARTFGRKLSDYLSIMLICPILLIMSSSVTVFFTSQITLIAERLSFFGPISGLIFFSLKLLPYGVIWFLFSFIYMFMPNTKVSFKGALLAGVTAGTIYQLVQWAYIFFQIGVSKYNAIYGSFAALPLFLVWLQISWLVVLFGAEVSFAADNEETYEFEKDCLDASLRFRRLLALRIVELCVKHFDQGKPPLSAVEISHILETPIRLVREILFDLVNAHVLSEVRQNGFSLEYYQPAQDIDRLTVKRVVDALDRRGTDHVAIVKDKELENIATRLDSIDRLVTGSSENILLKNL